MGLTSFVEIGKETVDKVDTTRYSAAPLKFDPVFEDDLYEFWVDGDHNLVQHRRSYKSQSTHTSNGVLVYQNEVAFDFTFKFSELGEVNIIEAPATSMRR